MSRGTSDRNLLVGMLAYQNGFVRREQLLSAMSAWLVEKNTPLEEIFLRHGALDVDAQQLLTALVQRHMAMHDNRAEQSLASISSLGSVREDIRSLADSELNASLLQVTSAPQMDPFATLSASVGTTTSNGGRFRILRPHARGGLGEVHVALDTELNREVALKEIRSPHADFPESRARFMLEAEITGGLEHPGVVPIYGLGTYADGRPYYAMRFIRGDSLKEALDRYHRDSNKSRSEKLLQLRKLLGRFIDVCNAIEYSHSRGILHRDLKPGNIMLGKHGETLVVDWGLAKPLGPNGSSLPRVPQDGSTTSYERPLVPSSSSGSAPTQLGAVLGTPAYMSPEQAAGWIDRLGTASDVYSLGATLYQLLTGVPPVQSEATDYGVLLQKIQRGEFPPPRTVKNDIPKALEAICLKAMAIRPEDRYASAEAVADDVEHWLADEPVAAYAESIAERASRHVRQHKHWTVAAGAVLLIVAAASAAAAVAVLLIVAAVASAAAMAISQRNKENVRLATANLELANKERAARRDAEHKHRETQLQAARLLFEQGWTKHVNGNDSHAILLMAESLRNLEQIVVPTEADEGTLALTANQLGISIRDHLLYLALSLTTLRFLVRHSEPVAAISFSPDGTKVATASWDSTARIWDVNSGRLLGNELKHRDRVTAVVWSPDGRTLATGSRDKVVQLWNADTQEPIAGPWQSDDAVHQMVFNNDGTALAVASHNTVRVWQTATVTESSILLEHADKVFDVAFSPNGTLLATACRDGAARLWDWPKRRLLHSRLEHGEAVYAVSFSSDGMLLGTASGDNTARIWDTSTGQSVLEPLRHENSVSDLAFSCDGTRLATASYDNTARIWAVATGKMLWQPLHHADGVHSVAFSPDDTRVVTATRDGTVQLWCAQSGQPLGESLQHSGWIHTLSFSPDGTILATASRDGTARLWDLFADQGLKDAIQQRDSVMAVTFSQDGRKMAAASRDGTAVIWEVHTAASTGPTLKHESSVYSIAFSPDGKELATSAANCAFLWDASTGKSLYPPMQHRDVVYRVCFSPDGETLATASYDNTCCLWEVKQGNTAPKTLAHERAVSDVVFSPDGKIVATASWDHTVRFWNSRNGESLGPVLQHNDAVNAATFSPDGTMLATASADNTARIWSVESGTSLHEFRHGHVVRILAFSPDGTRLVTGSDDNTARLWNTSTGQQIGDALQHTNILRAVCFTPDGTRVATASWDRTARLWDSTTGKPLGQALHHGQGVTTACFNPDGSLLATGSRDATVRIWDMPKRISEAAEAICTWVQNLTGCALTETGAIRRLKLDEMCQIQEELVRAGGPPVAYQEALKRRSARH